VFYLFALKQIMSCKLLSIYISYMIVYEVVDRHQVLCPALIDALADDSKTVHRVHLYPWRV